MIATTSPEFRFREYRERAGLSHDEAAQQMGITSPAVWDIESCEDEISECYSPSQVRQFCRVLGIRPIELFGGEITGSPISAVELVRLIHEQCRSRGVTLEQFEDTVGWRLSACIEPPDHLLEDITIDGLQWLCRELGFDWHRVILGL
jgi:transcriptional regulator with XRE-family HTH domain